MKIARAVPLLLLAAAPAAAAAGQIVIDGILTRADHQTYVAREFEVPDGIESLTVELEHGGAEQRTVIDLGLEDPAGFRGWTGSNKSRISLSAFDSTPGYRNGPILSGTWTLLLGVPNIRDGVETPYRATITLDPRHDLAGALRTDDEPIESGPRWYRGDLHSHTGHSDGYCLSAKRISVPCPVHLTVEAGVAAGLDFLAITDHNTLSHHQALRELQPYHDDILLIPGREITTFYGHANVFGAAAPIDHRIGPTAAGSIGELLAEVRAQEALISINHPALPSGEVCMGCGWRLTDMDFRDVDAVEVVNGGAWKQMAGMPGAEGGIAFWHSILDRGVRVTAVAGSDNHDPELSRNNRQAPVGSPATVVYADSLSLEDVFAGIRSGRVYIDVSGRRGRTLELSASTGETAASMGGSLSAPEGAVVELVIRTAGSNPGDTVELISNGGRKLRIGDPARAPASETRRHRVVSDGEYAWLRANVRSADGELLVLGNPVYINIED